MLLGVAASMIISLDIGASLTKGILVDENLRISNKYVTPTEEPRATALMVIRYLLNMLGASRKGTVTAVVVSGGGSKLIENEILGLPIRQVDEIKAIGLGGLLLTGKNEGLIVSAGTGTAIVAAYNNGGIIKHVGGTGVGGGTILSLIHI